MSTDAQLQDPLLPQVKQIDASSIDASGQSSANRFETLKQAVPAGYLSDAKASELSTLTMAKSVVAYVGGGCLILQSVLFHEETGIPVFLLKIDPDMRLLSYVRGTRTSSGQSCLSRKNSIKQFATIARTIVQLHEQEVVDAVDDDAVDEDDEGPPWSSLGHSKIHSNILISFGVANLLRRCG